jgi:hypothetical protein
MTRDVPDAPVRLRGRWAVVEVGAFTVTTIQQNAPVLEQPVEDPPLSPLERRLAWAAIALVVVFALGAGVLWLQFGDSVAAAPFEDGWRLFICH